MNPVERVGALWQRLEARDWVGARALLHDTATLHWVSSGEHFDDADAVIRVQALYPQGGSLRVVEVNPFADGRVHSLVEVTHGAQRFFANSLFRLEAGLIIDTTRYRAPFEAPPAWRTAQAIGAYHRDPTEPPGS